MPCPIVKTATSASAAGGSASRVREAAMSFVWFARVAQIQGQVSQGQAGTVSIKSGNSSKASTNHE